jgi:hypothetical protein
MAHAAWKWMAVAAALGSGVFAACSDKGGGGNNDDETDAGPDDGPGENLVRPGLGDDEGTPQGTPLELPAGIQVSATILGEDAGEGECEGATIPPAGSGRAVWACMKVTNSSGGPVDLELKPGLTLLARYQDGQHGMLLERIRVLVPSTGGGTGGIDAGTDAGTGEGVTFVIPLHMYCLNESRSPSFDRMEYELGPVLSDPDIQALLTLLQGKTIDTDEERDLVQEAIYKITEGRGLTRADRETLLRNLK